MANGRVRTGFSKPYVALYSATGNDVTYSSGMILARGVEVNVEAESSDDNNFYADNIVAESASGVFTGGTVTLTVDGLKDAAAKLILGLPTAGTDGWFDYGDSMQIPYVGIGFVVRYMEDGATSYVPIVLTKAMFATPSEAATTQGEEIDWQTQELTAEIFRDDTANHTWKKVNAGQTTEAAAEALIKTFFNIQ